MVSLKEGGVQITIDLRTARLREEPTGDGWGEASGKVGYCVPIMDIDGWLDDGTAITGASEGKGCPKVSVTVSVGNEQHLLTRLLAGAVNAAKATEDSANARED